MKFTYQAYRELLSLLREQGYAIRNYHDYEDAPRCVILRHDISNDQPTSPSLILFLLKIAFT